MTTPETSIIVRTFNEERLLPALLGAIQRQQYRDYEIVNVDSGSYDRTTEIARSYGARVLRIKSEDFTFGYSLNVGIEAAEGRFMVIISAHAEPVDDRWLGSLVGHLSAEDVAMVYGRQQGVATSKYGEHRDLRRTFGPRKRVLRPPHFLANNANSALPRALWKQHPFDAALPGQEDIEWAKHWMEQGWKVVYEPDASIYHVHEESWPRVRRRYYREAVATRAIGVWKPRHVVTLAVKEVGYLATDLLHATREGALKGYGAEIVRFRFNKAHGTVAGILDGTAMDSPASRQALLFERVQKAVVVHSPGVATLDEVGVPVVKPGDVLIKVAYAGVNSNDLGILSGDSSYSSGDKAVYPVTPGHELSGHVVDIGANVAHLAEGDAVVVEPVQGCGYCQECRRSNPVACREVDGSGVRGKIGSYAEYVATPGRFVHKLPPEADLRAAVLCEPLAVVLKGLKRLVSALTPRPEPARVAVLGAGPVGHLCSWVLASREHQVTVFDRDERRLRYFDGTAISIGTSSAGLEEFDVLVEATGHAESLRTMLEGSGPGATLLLLGLPYARREFELQGRAALDKTIVSSFGAGPEEYEEAIRLLPRIPTGAFTECILPIDRFEEAWERFKMRDSLKVLLRVS